MAEPVSLMLAGAGAVLSALAAVYRRRGLAVAARIEVESAAIRSVVDRVEVLEHGREADRVAIEDLRRQLEEAQWTAKRLAEDLARATQRQTQLEVELHEARVEKATERARAESLAREMAELRRDLLR